MNNKVEALENIRGNVEYELVEYENYYQGKNSFGVQDCLITLMSGYYSVSVLTYLVEGDKDLFFESCYNSAACFDVHNKYCRYGMPHDLMSYSLDDATGFFAAILSLPKKTAKNVVGAIYPECRYGEDEYTFCFTYGLGAFLLDDKEESQKNYLNILKEFRDEGREADIEIGIYEGLFNKDRDAFVEAMRGYLERREKQIANKEGIQVGEDSICIEALAMIRLAQEVGIDVKVNHRLTPLELQGNYPDVSSYNRQAPRIKEEARDPEFWEDWSPVEDVL